MQPFPSLDAHRLYAEEKGFFTVCGSRRVGELEPGTRLLGSAFLSWLAGFGLLIQPIVAAHTNQGKSVLDEQKDG